MAQCDGQCDDEGSDAEPPDPNDFEEDDLDGRAGFYDGDGHHFGDEPYGTVIDTWACNHDFHEARPPPSTAAMPGHMVQRMLECHRCFQVPKIREQQAVWT